MQRTQTILFLYTRLPDYFYRCVQHFVSNYPFKAVIVRYKGDPNTKYSFEPDERIELLYKDDLNVPAFINNLQPSAIVISGWSDSLYTSASKKYIAKIPVVLTMDNPWLGLMRQRVLTTVAPWYIHSFSNYAWVPGWSQYEYVRRLGFAKDKILNGMYCADTDKFYQQQPNGVSYKADNYPRTIVYVGRMVEYKQPHVIARVFNKIVKEGNYDWRLVFAGEGPLKKSIEQQRYEHVETRQFLDPSALPDFYKGSGVFCLPSNNEHWGVSVHEAAAAGLPLLLSDTVESGSTFLINAYNGFAFQTGNEKSIEGALQRLINMSNKDLITMGNNSIALSKTISHETWSATLNTIFN